VKTFKLPFLNLSGTCPRLQIGSMPLRGILMVELTDCLDGGGYGRVMRGFLGVFLQMLKALVC
jgi:hypothetical protein